MSDTTTTAVDATPVDEYTALVSYMEAAKVVKALDPAYTEAQDALNAAQDAIDVIIAQREAAMVAVRAIVTDHLNGSDPLSVLPPATKPGRKTGPRDPNRRSNVVAALSTPRTLSELVSLTGEESSYITQVIQAAEKAGTLVKDGERGSFRYSIVAQDTTPDPEPVVADEPAVKSSRSRKAA